MVKNRFFAAVFRFFTAGVIIYGLIIGSGIQGGPTRILSYTVQSNILCAAFFIFTGFASLVDAVKNGVRGDCCYLPRLSSGILIAILFTMLIFWCALAPFAGEQNYLSAGNLILHTFSAILAMIERALFYRYGSINKKDVWLFALLPFLYVLESLTLGFSGIVYYVKNGVEYNFPYYFMDFNIIGWLAALCICIIAAVYIGACYLLIILDNRLECRLKNKAEQTEHKPATRG